MRLDLSQLMCSRRKQGNLQLNLETAKPKEHVVFRYMEQRKSYEHRRYHIESYLMVIFIISLKF